MGFSGVYAEATISSLPGSSLDQIPLFVNGDDFDIDWWDACNVDDGLYGRASIDGITEIPIHFTEIERASKTCKIRLNRGTVPTTGTLKVRIYPPNTSNPQYSISDPFAQQSVYKSSIKGYYPKGGGNDVTANENHLVSNGGVIEGNTASPFGKSTAYNGTQWFSGTPNVLAAPLTMMSLANMTVTGASRGLISIGDISVADNYFALINSALAGRFWARGGAFVFAKSGNDTLLNTWSHYAAREISTSSRKVYLDADTINAGADGTLSVPSGIDTITIGSSADSSPWNNDGVQSHVWLFNEDIGEDWVVYEKEMVLTGIWGAWVTTTPAVSAASPDNLIQGSIVFKTPEASVNIFAEIDNLISEPLEISTPSATQEFSGIPNDLTQGAIIYEAPNASGETILEPIDLIQGSIILGSPTASEEGVAEPNDLIQGSLILGRPTAYKDQLSDPINKLFVRCDIIREISIRCDI